MFVDRRDVNYLLNYCDLRARETKIVVDGNMVDHEEYSKRLVSNNRMVLDSLDLPKLKCICENSRSLCVTLRKEYPFHSSMISDYADLVTNGDNCLYSCSVIYLRNDHLEIGAIDAPAYYREGSRKELHKTEGCRLEGAADEGIMYLVYRPLRTTTDHLNTVSAMRLTSGTEMQSPIIDLRNSKSNNERSFFDELEFSKALEEEFGRTVRKKIPCFFRGKLSAIVDVQAKYREYTYYVNSWEFSSNAGNDYFGKFLDEKQGAALAPGFTVFNDASTDEVLKLVLSGIGGTRSKRSMQQSDITLFCSPESPNCYVKTNGSRVWLYDGEYMQGMEDRATREIVSVGQRLIYDKIKEVRNKRFLFCGLGMGLLQQRVSSENEVVTVEYSPSIRELARYCATVSLDLGKVICGDFFDFELNEGRFDYVVIDAPVEREQLTARFMKNLGDSLMPGASIILNMREPDDKVVNALRHGVGCDDMNSHRPSEMFDQTVVTMRKRDDTELTRAAGRIHRRREIFHL